TEDYSDFGTTTNPKVGVRYVPSEELTIRATWGKSFKAPSLQQENNETYAQISPAWWYGYSGPGQAIELYGGNPELNPEKATSWTFGGEYRPSFSRSMRLSANYFNIDYIDRIVTPIPDEFTAYLDPLNAMFIQPNPSPQQLAEL